MPTRTSPEYEIVTDQTRLEAVCQRLAEAGSFAFDTEFVAEETYERHVCLLQVATENDCALIDPLDGLDVSAFWELVVDDSCRKIVHSGAEDIAICWTQCNKPPANVFDTQIAAGFVGLEYPLSLARLVRRAAHATLHKSQTLTDWRKRPLSQAQLEYAVQDVIHLPRVHQFLARKLAALGREQWAVEECDKLCAAPASNDGAQKLRRIRGAGSLGRRELAIADGLLKERDRLAAEYNRPARAVLKDHILVEIAKRGWTDIERLRSLRGINLSNVALRRMAEAVENARKLPKDQWPKPNVAEDDTPEQIVLADLLSAVLRDFCNKSGVALSMLTNKQELRAFVRSHGDNDADPTACILRSGWRKDAVGELLDSVLSGRAAVRVDAEKPRLQIE